MNQTSAINFKKFLHGLLIIMTVLYSSLLVAEDFDETVDDNAPNIWPMIRQEFQIQFNPKRPEIARQIHYFLNNRSYFYSTLEKAGPLIYYIYQQTQNRDLPSELALIPFIESEYDPFASSGAGAAGLWQFMPRTANGFGMEINWWYDDRLDIERSTQKALNYLSYLNKFFEGDWMLAMAAYDSGEGTVLNAVKRNLSHNQNALFWRLHLPRETKSYIPKLLAIVALIEDPKYYGIELPPVKAHPYFQDVEVPAHLPLTVIAELAETDITTLQLLNAEFKQLTTGPRKTTHILLPVDKAALFKTNLALNPKVFSHTWLYHNVQHGENLSTIAKKHFTSVKLLKAVNHLKSNRIYFKQKLIVPNIHIRITKYRSKPTTREKYVIQPGDNLTKIAHKFHTTISALKKHNGLLNDVIRPGEKLIVGLEV